MQSYRVRRYETVCPDWLRCERDLIARGVSMPLSHRSAWASLVGNHWLLAAHDSRDRCRAAIGVEVRRTRALPGCCMLRAERIGTTDDHEALVLLVEELARLTKSDRRVLSADVVVFSRDELLRAQFGQRLRDLGFQPASSPQAYRDTACVDLALDDDALLSRFASMARRNIRLAEKRPIALRPITCTSHVAQMTELVRETRTRTGGMPPRRSLAALVELAKLHPELVRIVGVFSQADEQLLAFATGLAHGDHVSYADAASTRRTPVQMPLGYAPVWELMRWAKTLGANWFDFGGITRGTHSDAGDRLGGISDFKRMFKGEIITVAEEWTLTPRPRRAALVAYLTTVAGRLRSSLPARRTAPP